MARILTRSVVAESLPRRVRFEAPRSRPTLEGRWFANGGHALMGELPPKWWPLLVNAPGEVYVVYSYDTPIAWWDPVAWRWTVPEHVYSHTTTIHQNMVLDAIAKEGSDVFRP